jgi:outer membrane protein assembly factor BamA
LSNRKLGVRLLCLAIFIIIATPAVSRADYSFIPLPVYATSRNGGSDFGFLPVWLMKEQNEYVYAIIAPSVVYNTNTATNLTYRYLGFPTIDKNYRIFVNRSLGTDQEYTGEYWDNKFAGGKFRIYGKFTFFRDTTYRFFGLTENSREIDETNYSNLELSPQFSLGYYLPHNFIVSYGEKLRWVTIRRGSADTLRYIQSKYPGLEGVTGGAVIERRLKLTYDTRDNEVFPTEGWYANVFEEVGQSFTHARTYTRTGLDARTYISIYDKRFITVLKAEFQLTGGHKVPFFVESTIGGENTLRGLGNYRFRDDGFILFNVEERIKLFKLHIFGVWSEWEAAPFVDAGRVYSSFRKNFIKDYEFNPGIGFRAIVHPNIVGRVDLGYGREGLNAFVGLDFPF